MITIKFPISLMPRPYSQVIVSNEILTIGRWRAFKLKTKDPLDFVYGNLSNVRALVVRAFSAVHTH